MPYICPRSPTAVTITGDSNANVIEDAAINGAYGSSTKVRAGHRGCLQLLCTVRFTEHYASQHQGHLLTTCRGRSVRPC